MVSDNNTPEQMSPQQMSPQQAREVMDARALHLAETPATAPDSKSLMEVVQFTIGGEHCAVETRFVNQVLREASVTAIPAVDNRFAGLINLRGQIVLVVDLSPLLGLERSSAACGQLLVLGAGSPELAILVDEVDQVVSLRIADVLKMSAGLAHRHDIASGCTPDARLILNGEALLKCDEFYIEENE